MTVEGYRRPLSYWESSGIPSFFHEEGVDDDRRLFEATELLGESELAEEGKAMGHCVATYSQLCASGRSSIWSLRMQISTGRVIRLATVEVRCTDKLIVQVRKRANKPPTPRELSLLERWGDRGGPKPGALVSDVTPRSERSSALIVRTDPKFALEICGFRGLICPSFHGVRRTGHAGARRRTFRGCRRGRHAG